MADEGTTAGQGPLLGWNKAQDEVSALARNVANLNKALTDATARIEGMAKGGGSGNSSGRSAGLGMASNDQWNQGSNFGHGRSNGGQDAPATMPRMALGGGSSGGGPKAPNGGGSRFSTGSQGGGGGNNGGTSRTRGGGFLQAAKYVTAWGQGKLPDQVTMQTTGYQAAQNSSQSWHALRDQAFHSNYTAQSTTDAAVAYTTLSYQGMSPGSSSFTNQWNYATGTSGYMNPGMSQAQRAAGQAAAWQPGTYNNLRMFGINTVVGGTKQSPRQIAQQIVGKFPELRQIKNAQQLSATLDDPMSGLNQSLQSWGLDANTLTLVKNELRGMLLAQTHGSSMSQYVSTANQLDNGTASQKKAALGQMGKWGIGGSLVNTLQTRAGTLRNQDVNINDAFTSGLQDATAALDQFSSALQSVLKNTGLDNVIGYGGGAASMIGSAVGSGMGFFGGMGLSRLLGGGGGGLLGRLGGLFGGGGGGAAGAAGAAGEAGAGGLGSAVAADGVPIITTLGAGGAAAGGIGAAGTAGVVAAGAAAAGFNGYMGWKYGAQPVHGWTRGFKNASIVAGMTNPISGAMNMGAMARRAWDKMHGKNDESWWGLLNPFGQEKPTGQGDGNPGGAMASGSANTSTGGASVATGTQGAGKTAAAVIAIGMKYLNTPYKWGGNSPQSGFDCSGLMQYIFGRIGVSLPRTAAQQQKVGTSVPLNQVRAGDLMFVGDPAHHVVMCVGNGKCLEAPHTGADVRIRSFSPGEFTSATRILGAVGNLGDQTNSNSNTAGSGSTRLSTVGYGGDIGNYGSTEEVDAIAAGVSAIGAANLGSGVGANQNNQTNTASNGNQGAGPLPSGNLKSWISSALGILHMDTAANERDVNTIIMHESGGNPRAVNNWDSNAKAGTPSEGLMQTIGPTFNRWSIAGHKNIWNPIDNIIAGVRYADDRYGSLANVPGIVSMNNGGGYKGYAVGSTNVDVDQTARIHKGEMIIPAYQAEAIRNALSNNTPLAGGLPGSGAGGKATLNFHAGAVVIQVQGVMDQQSARDAAQQFMTALAEDNRIQLIAAGK